MWKRLNVGNGGHRADVHVRFRKKLATVIEWHERLANGEVLVLDGEYKFKVLSSEACAGMYHHAVEPYIEPEPMFDLPMKKETADATGD